MRFESENLLIICIMATLILMTLALGGLLITKKTRLRLSEKIINRNCNNKKGLIFKNQIIQYLVIVKFWDRKQIKTLLDKNTSTAQNFRLQFRLHTNFYIQKYSLKCIDKVSRNLVNLFLIFLFFSKSTIMEVPKIIIVVYLFKILW